MIKTYGGRRNSQLGRKARLKKALWAGGGWGVTFALSAAIWLFALGAAQLSGQALLVCVGIGLVVGIVRGLGVYRRQPVLPWFD